MNPTQMARWKSQREQGRPRFVLVTGILSYGVPMFLVTTFLVPLLRHRPLPGALAIAIAATLWLLGGVLFGFMLWWVNERNYRIARERLGDGSTER